MPSGPQRPDLVIIRTGASSLHKQWPKNIDDSSRCWDLMLSHFADAPVDNGDADIVVRQGAFKFSAIARLFKDIPWLAQYRAVWLCDDDIMTSWADLRRLFDLFHSFDLALAQPALTSNSYSSFQMCKQQPNSLLRYTNFVEGMAPLFSQHALQLCLPSFENSISGWGIDWVWPKLLGNPRHRIGIIDGVAVEHTRPVASGPVRDQFSKLQIDPAEEMEEILRSYGITERAKLEYGFIAAQPRVA